MPCMYFVRHDWCTDMQMSLFSTIKSQAPPSPDVPKCYGLTGPISTDLPEEADLIQTRKLVDTLKEHGVFEDNMELQHRYDTSFPISLFSCCNKSSLGGVELGKKSVSAVIPLTWVGYDCKKSNQFSVTTSSVDKVNRSGRPSEKCQYLKMLFVFYLQGEGSQKTGVTL